MAQGRDEKVDTAVILGVAGMITLLIGFVLNLFKFVHADSVLYDLLNVLGCACLAVYAYALGSIPFLILELIWGIFSLYELIIVLKRGEPHLAKRRLHHPRARP